MSANNLQGGDRSLPGDVEVSRRQAWWSVALEDRDTFEQALLDDGLSGDDLIEGLSVRDEVSQEALRRKEAGLPDFDTAFAPGVALEMPDFRPSSNRSSIGSGGSPRAR